MPLSLNRWPVLPSWADPRQRTIRIPGTNKSIRCRRIAAPVFAAFLNDWHREMPKRLQLDQGRQYLGGYAFRPARSGAGWSNHSSSTAADIRWDVLLPDGQRHMTDEEQRILKRILKRYRTTDGHHILASGAWWRPGMIDEMHVELAPGWADGALRYTTPADVRNVRKRLGIKRNGVRTLTGGGKPRRPA